MAAFEHLPVERLTPRDLDFEPLRQGVDHRDADAVQPARGPIGARIELAAGMQRRHDDFERRFLRKFRMRIDRNAAAVVGDGEPAAGFIGHVDPGGMAGDRLVHGIVDDFGEEVMQRRLVGAADIHAGAAADRLQALEHFDRGRSIEGFPRRRRRTLRAARRRCLVRSGFRHRLLARRVAAEKIAVARHSIRRSVSSDSHMGILCHDRDQNWNGTKTLLCNRATAARPSTGSPVCHAQPLVNVQGASFVT